MFPFTPFAAFILGLILLASIPFVLTAYGLWKIHEKAGHPGWTAIIPIYHFWIEIQIARLPTWWIALFLFPLTSLVAVFMINIHMARNFGKDIGFGIGMTFLPFIFIPILGFGAAHFETNSPSTMI